MKLKNTIAIADLAANGTELAEGDLRLVSGGYTGPGGGRPKDRVTSWITIDNGERFPDN